MPLCKEANVYEFITFAKASQALSVQLLYHPEVDDFESLNLITVLHTISHSFHFCKKQPRLMGRGFNDLLTTGYFLNFFPASITTNTITPVAAAMDRSHPLNGTTSKKCASDGMYITIICKMTASNAMPANNGLVNKPILNNDSFAEREAKA